MKLKVAPWWPRFWAWLIDIIVIWIISAVLLFRVDFNMFHWGAAAFIGLIYWAVLESDGRQSIGKKALNLKLVGKDGKNASLGAAAISAFGKAFLLPLDMIIGVLARPGKKQRLFNMASDTNVIMVPEKK
ncbi:MAG TPA: RDD family protein [archaeon]|nr:RDD family protein [archaeon]